MAPVCVRVHVWVRVCMHASLCLCEHGRIAGTSPRATSSHGGGSIWRARASPLPGPRWDGAEAWCSGLPQGSPHQCLSPGGRLPVASLNRELGLGGAAPPQGGAVAAAAHFTDEGAPPPPTEPARSLSPSHSPPHSSQQPWSPHLAPPLQALPRILPTRENSCFVPFLGPEWGSSLSRDLNCSDHGHRIPEALWLPWRWEQMFRWKWQFLATLRGTHCL